MTSPERKTPATPGGARDRDDPLFVSPFSAHLFVRAAEVIGAVGMIGASIALVVLLLG